jgi:hypothetical protein
MAVVAEHHHHGQAPAVGAAASLPAAEGFAVLEPPVDEAAAAERVGEVTSLLAAFAGHLRDRTAHHLGTHYAARQARLLCMIDRRLIVSPPPAFTLLDRWSC